MPHLSVTCPHCDKRNEITASEVPEPINIHCTGCHAPLGTWSEIEQQGKLLDPNAGWRMWPSGNLS